MLLVIGVTLFIGGMLRMLFLYFFMLYCNGNIHKQLLKGVVRAPVSFFDANPAGRVLNRFSKDTIVMDSMLKFTQTEFFQLTFILIGNAIVI